MNLIISKLPEHEWQKYRDIRLLALKSDPYAFGSSFEEEVNLAELDWRNRMNTIWFAIIDGEPVGLIGLLKRENHASRHCGCIVSFWVKPAFRGHGLAKGLLQNLQQIAKNQGIRKISLNVTTTQSSAIRLYEKVGFTKIGILKENLLKDGVYLDEYYMEWFAT